MSFYETEHQYPHYERGAPSEEAEMIDAEIAEKMECRKCGGSCHYSGWYRPGSYIALAVCNRCGHEMEF